MGAPNLKSATLEITIDAGALAGGSGGPVQIVPVSGAVPDKTAYKIESLLATNTGNASTICLVTALWSFGGSDFSIAEAQQLAFGQTVNLLEGRPHHLPIGAVLSVWCPSGSADFTAPYAKLYDPAA